METNSPRAGEAERQARIVIADDDESTRILLTEALSEQPSVELVASAKDADEAIELVGEFQPDVAILDWSMPAGGGDRAAKEITDRFPQVAIIALTGMDGVEASYSMMSAGAVGLLQKGCSTEELIDAIHSAKRWSSD